jgi:hypothetical protein
VPECQPSEDSGASGVAVVQINAETGEITYRVVAWDLPATIAGPSTGAHIHVIDPNSPTGLTGPVVVPFERGLNIGLVAEGTTTNPTIAAAILADPESYYVNVHTTSCPTGTIRGQLGYHHKPICQGGGARAIDRPSLLRGCCSEGLGHNLRCRLVITGRVLGRGRRCEVRDCRPWPGTASGDVEVAECHGVGAVGVLLADGEFWICMCRCGSLV